MARTNVDEYTRHLSNGTEVKVASHERQYDGSQLTAARTPVQNYRREFLKQKAQQRREAFAQKLGEHRAAVAEEARAGFPTAKQRGKIATRKAKHTTKVRARQSWKMTKRGGKRLKRAYRAAQRHKKTTAACLAVGGVAEIGAAVAWQGIGAVLTTVTILGATVAGGLLIGKKGEQ